MLGCACKRVNNTRMHAARKCDLRSSRHCCVSLSPYNRRPCVQVVVVILFVMTFLLIQFKHKNVRVPVAAAESV